MVDQQSFVYATIRQESTYLTLLTRERKQQSQLQNPLCSRHNDVTYLFISEELEVSAEEEKQLLLQLLIVVQYVVCNKMFQLYESFVRKQEELSSFVCGCSHFFLALPMSSLLFRKVVQCVQLRRSVFLRSFFC